MTQNSSELGHYLVASTGQATYVRVVGLGNMNNCTPLSDFLESQSLRGVREFIFDFSASRGFDSTFMGILIGFALGEKAWTDDDDAWGDPEESISPDADARESCRVILINLSDELRKLLSSVGVDRVVEFCDSPQPAPDVKLTRLKARPVPVEQRLSRMVKAHENLMQLDRGNEQKFGTFLSMIKKELGRGD